MTIAAYDVTKDRYPQVAQADWPVRNAAAITPSDTAPVAIGPAALYARALYVGVAGDLTVIMSDDRSIAGVPVTFKNAPVGYHPLQVRMVMATGTAASSIVGLGE